MKKLFDETYEHEERRYRTLWYGYYGELDDLLTEEILDAIKDDLTVKSDDYAVHWVFYSDSAGKDAVDDKVRPSFMVRLREGMYRANYNMSDYDFATRFDCIEAFKYNVEKRLNGRLKLHSY